MIGNIVLSRDRTVAMLAAPNHRPNISYESPDISYETEEV